MTDEYAEQYDPLFERAREHHKAWEDQDRVDLQHIMSSKAGRRFVWRVLSECGVNDPNPTDNDTLRRLGRRDVGLSVTDWVFTLDPKAYTLMLNEALQRDNELKELLNG